MKSYFLYAIIIVTFASLTSCSVSTQLMREHNTFVVLGKDDFIISKQVQTEVQPKLSPFSIKSGTVATDGFKMHSFPIIGGLFGKRMSKAETFALYQLMQENPGYDVIFYPQFISTQSLGKSRVLVKARLGKLSATKNFKS